MVKLIDFDYDLARLLLDRVENKKGTITYEECAEILSKETGEKVYAHGSLRMPLARICELCYELELPLISAFVILKKDFTGSKTGSGFYTKACELKPEYKAVTPIEAWKTELSLIRKCKDWSSLHTYLSI